MGDDLKKKGKADRSKVSQQSWEVDYLVKKTSKPLATVKKAIADAGPQRKNVIKKLK